MSVAAGSCADGVDVVNDLSEPLRLTLVPDALESGAIEEFGLPASQRWLAPRERRTIRPRTTGWLVGERRTWLDVVGVNTLSHVVRRATNTSIIAAARMPLLSPLKPPGRADATRADNESFVLLINAETQALRLCAEPPEGTNVHSRCYGMLPALGRRYVRNLAAGTTLEAYEPVWGVRASALGAERAGGDRRAHRVARVLPLTSAGYAASYRALTDAEISPDDAAANAADAPAPPSVSLMNHLSSTAVLCRDGDGGAAEGVSTIECAEAVRPRSYRTLELGGSLASAPSWCAASLVRCLSPLVLAHANMTMGGSDAQGGVRSASDIGAHERSHACACRNSRAATVALQVRGRTLARACRVSEHREAPLCKASLQGRLTVGRSLQGGGGSHFAPCPPATQSAPRRVSAPRLARTGHRRCRRS